MDARLLRIEPCNGAFAEANERAADEMGSQLKLVSSRSDEVGTSRTWGTHTALERQSLQSDLQAALDICPPGRRMVLLKCLLNIATLQTPRPASRNRQTGDWPTSRSMLCTYTGISKFHMYEDPDLRGLLDRFLPRLDALPGYQVRVTGCTIEPINPLAAEVALALDALELSGGRIPRDGKRPSIAGFCALVDFRYEDVFSNGGAKQRITDSAKVPGALQEVARPRTKQGQLKNDRELFKVCMQRLRSERQPLPCSQPGVLDYGALRLQLGVESETLLFQPDVQAQIVRHRSEFGLAPPQVREPDLPTYSQFEHYLREQQHTVGQSTTAVNNRLSSLRRALKAEGLTSADTFNLAAFEDVDTLAQRSADLDPRLSLPSARTHKSNLLAVAASALEFSLLSDGLPLAGPEALGSAIDNSGLSYAELSRRTGIPVPVLRHARSGARKLPDRYWNYLPALEDQLGTDGRLALRLTRDFSTKNICPSPYYASLPENVRRALPKGAHRLDDDTVKRLANDLEENYVRQNRMYSKVLRSAGKIWSRIPDIPCAAPFLAEFILLKQHKTAAVPADGCARRPKGLWSLASAETNERNFRRMFRFAAAPKEYGGLNLQTHQLSLSLLLNWQFVASYLDWSAALFSGTQHNGQLRGPSLSLHLVQVIDVIVGLLDANYGWIYQNPHLFTSQLQPVPTPLPPLQALEELRLRNFVDVARPPTDLAPPAFRCAHNQDNTTAETEALQSGLALGAAAIGDAISSSAFEGASVMPGPLEEQAKTDWREACRVAWQRLRDLRAYLTHLVEPSRNPFEPILFIVKSDNPMSYLVDIIEAAQSALPCRRTAPLEHAFAVRDLLMFVLLVCTALRSKNIRSLIWRPDGNGEVRFTANDDVEIVISWRRFKNFGSKHLFGPTGLKVDYEREIKDWFGIKSLFEHYIRHCRDVLIAHYSDYRRAPTFGRRNTDALFPSPGLREMDQHQFGNIVRNLTRKFHVLDPATGLVRPGYMFFGPHAVRDIIATHVVNTMEEAGELRWEFAADLLQTGIEMAKLRYAFREMRKRMAKTDGIYDALSQGFRRRALT